MEKTIIVTDLTRFSNRETVCTAGIDIDTFQCIRPMPYLKTQRCRELRLLPGAILKGEFSATTTELPHSEDMVYTKLKYVGPATSEQFRSVLVGSLQPSIEAGFGTELPWKQKHIAADSPPSHSIITISVAPNNIRIVRDQFNPEKIKLHLTDNVGKDFSFLAITDLGFHAYAQATAGTEGSLDSVNEFIHSQEEVFLRVGLARRHQSPDGRDGFWLQVNGIYTFPNFLEDIRSYR